MEIIESGRDIPVLREADVLICGGTTAAVTAALAAREKGARVFLAAAHAYLGEDLCATGRPWLEPGEEPESALAKKMFAPPLERRGLAFACETSRPAKAIHKDDFVRVEINDGLWGHAFGHSLQFGGPVTITASLDQDESIGEVRLMLHQAAGDFGVESVEIETSPDKAVWTPRGRFLNAELGKRDYVEEALVMRCPVGANARHVRISLVPAPGARRILLGQAQLLPPRNWQGKPGRVRNVTPMQVKRVLEDALIEAGIPFLYECTAVAALQDASGGMRGVEVVNRAGRQAILARIVIDATDRAHVARLAGAEAAPYPAGLQAFTRIVVGGEPRTEAGQQVRRVPLQFPLGGLPAIKAWEHQNKEARRQIEDVLEYHLSLPMQDASFASFAEAEQRARDLTFHPGQLDDSERLFQVPPDPVRCRKTLSGAWSGAGQFDLDACRPRGVERLFVLGACADLSREAAGKLLRPIDFMALGSRVGEAAALEAKALTPAQPAWKKPPPEPRGGLETRELLHGARPWSDDKARLRLPPRSLPVWGEYDVVVAGGGTSGACAAIGAARNGARTLVIENLPGLGGVATAGQIGCYCYGYMNGFTRELDKGLAAQGAAAYAAGKMEWLRTEIRKAGGEIWFGAQGAGALVEAGRVAGVVVATPHGRGALKARAVIDATGNADIAAAAGAGCLFGSAVEFGIQQAGLPRRELGASYLNSDWTFSNDADLLDRWTLFVVARRLNGNAYDLGQLPDTRERRRIVGDYTLTPMDVVNSRTFPDTINLASSGTLDKHSEPIHPYYRINNFAGGITCVPYRCLLPRGLEGILVTGLACSADADAMPAIRMQPDMQNQGYAAGLAAAMAAKAGLSPRCIDFPSLQARLVAKGCIPPERAGQPDSFPLPPAAVREAVQTLRDKDYSRLGPIMASPERSLPLLRKAIKNTPAPEGRLRCAHVLGMMGDSAGADVLIEAVRSFRDFEGKDIGYYYPRMTWLDSYLLALGATRDPRALKPILEKLELLGRTPDARPSHIYCIALALEALGDHGAAPALAAELKKAGGTAGAALTLDDARRTLRSFTGLCGFLPLELARSLFHCGDHEGLARKALETFASDVRGPIALHARGVLEGFPR